MNKLVFATVIVLGAVGVAKIAAPTRTSSDNEREVLQLVSDDFRMDRRYESMEGPATMLSGFTLDSVDLQGRDTVWLKGLKARAEARGGQAEPSEYFCHSNLAVVKPGKKPDTDDRLFTLVEGRLDLELPQGFGIPLDVNTSLSLDTTSRHVNFQPGQSASDVRIHTDISYLTGDTENGEAMKPLCRRTLYIYDKAKAGRRPSPDGDALTGEICAPSEESGLGLSLVNGNPIHWRVPSGTHQYQMDVTEMLRLSNDTTAHYVTGHLHTHSDWLRLVERETGKVVLELQGERFPGRRGLQSMSYISSRTGIVIKKDLHYNLVASYTNPGSEPIDAMAILYLYLLDQSTHSD